VNLRSLLSLEIVWFPAVLLAMVLAIWIFPPSRSESLSPVTITKQTEVTVYPSLTEAANQPVGQEKIEVLCDSRGNELFVTIGDTYTDSLRLAAIPKGCL
jgi:hypothetical protein